MRRVLLASLLLAASALTSQPVLAQEAASVDDIEALETDLAPMGDAELASERGGLMTPFGEINFGAVLRTIIDGQVAMQTQLTWTPQGPVQSVVSNLGSTIQNTVQNATNLGPNTPIDLGATNTALQQAGQKPLENLPGMDLVAEAVGAGIDQAVEKTRPATESGATLVGLAGEFVPPNNPTLDTVFDALAEAKPSASTQPRPAPSVGPLNQGPGAGQSVDVAGGALGFDVPGGPAQTLQSVTGGTPTELDDPIGALVVAATTGGHTPEQVAAAAAALGINLGELTGGNAMIVAGEDGGATAIIQNISNGSFSNMVFNTASGQNIQIETDITIDMPGLEQFQQQILSDQLQMNLHDAIGAALVNAGL